MRHGKKINSLGRKAAHRKAMLSNMACSLIEHKRINTTVAKAKALRGYLEPLLTKSKTDSTHSRRIVFKYLQSKDATNELFREVAPKIADRPGGYLRIIRIGTRLGDKAEMCMIELVDFNELMTKEPKEKKTRRSRRGKGGASKKAAETTTENKSEEAEAVKEEKPKAEKKEAEAKKEEPKEKKDTAKKETTKKAEPKAKKETPKKEETKAKKETAKKEEPKADAKKEAKSEDKKDDKKDK